MKPLEGKVAVVAGSSRGAGRGIALALGDAGAIVYVTGRTARAGPKPADAAPGTVDDTAEEVTARGGKGIPVRVDYTVEAEVAALFERVQREHGKLDVLATAVWGGADAFASADAWMSAWGKPFWDQPSRQWQCMMTAGAFAYFIAGYYAARMMAAAGKGLIVGVTDGIVGEAKTPEYGGGQLVWDLAHASINRLMQDMAIEGKPHHIAVITLMPGFMQTERVLMHMKTEEMKKMFRFDLSESTLYIGRAVAGLAADPQVLEKTGKIHFVAELAREYGFTDADGRFIPKWECVEAR